MLHFLRIDLIETSQVEETTIKTMLTELEECVCDGKAQFRVEKVQLETATIHFANAMMTNDSMLYVVISAYPGIENRPAI